MTGLLYVAVVSLALLEQGVGGSDTVLHTPNGYAYTLADAARLNQGFQRSFTDRSHTGVVFPTPDVDMPKWDRVAHYVGPRHDPEGKLYYEMWVNEGFMYAVKDLTHAEPSVGMPIYAMFLMAAMDSGLAGPKWKSYFEQAKRDDGRLDSSVQDRYRNRHALVVVFAQVYAERGQKVRSEDASKSRAEALTEPLATALAASDKRNREGMARCCQNFAAF